jgi:hypothetical protein
MLLGKSGSGTKTAFKANAKDGRFTAIMDNKDYALDPTNRHFKKVADGEFLKEQ